MLSGALCLSLSALAAAAVIPVRGDGEEERAGTAAAAAAAARSGDLGPGEVVGRIETVEEEKGEEMREVRRERMAVSK